MDRWDDIYFSICDELYGLGRLTWEAWDLPT